MNSRPRRFLGASRIRAVGPKGPFEVRVADGHRLRLAGLARLPENDLVPLLFPSCRSLHTFWMRTPIDVVWIDLVPGAGRVLAVRRKLPPRRTANAPRAGRKPRHRIAGLELPAGLASDLGLEAGVWLSLPL